MTCDLVTERDPVHHFCVRNSKTYDKLKTSKSKDCRIDAAITVAQTPLVTIGSSIDPIHPVNHLQLVLRHRLPVGPIQQTLPCQHQHRACRNHNTSSDKKTLIRTTTISGCKRRMIEKVPLVLPVHLGSGIKTASGFDL